MTEMVYILSREKKRIVDMIPKDLYMSMGYAICRDKYEAIGCPAGDWTTDDEHSRKWLKANGYM